MRCVSEVNTEASYAQIYNLFWSVLGSQCRQHRNNSR